MCFFFVSAGFRVLRFVRLFFLRVIFFFAHVVRCWKDMGASSATSIIKWAEQTGARSMFSTIGAFPPLTPGSGVRTLCLFFFLLSTPISLFPLSPNFFLLITFFTLFSLFPLVGTFSQPQRGGGLRSFNVITFGASFLHSTSNLQGLCGLESHSSITSTFGIFCLSALSTWAL